MRPFHWPADIKTGGSAVGMCVLSQGSEPLNFKWLKNGVELSENTRITAFKQGSFSTLEIKNIESSDRANYTCSVQNNHGTGSYTAPLVIKGMYKQDLVLQMI